jgi:ABC-type amino acid transport substrate-binding protein
LDVSTGRFGQLLAGVHTYALALLIGGGAAGLLRLLDMRFSEPYMKSTISFVVRDHQRAKFSSRDAVQALPKPRIGVLNVPYYIDTLQTYLRQAELVKLDSPSEFFAGKSEDLDALFNSAERGSTWTLIHPEYSVAVPQPGVLAAPVSIAMANDADSLAHFVNAWLRLKREDKTLDQLYAYWILGRGAQTRKPRWSVIRNVLGWID